MITVRIKGGLGNQLFQYVIGYIHTKENGQDLKFNPSFTSNMTPRGYKLPQLNVQYSDVVEDRELPRKVQIFKNKYVNKAFRMLKDGEIYRYKSGIYFLEKDGSFRAGVLELRAKNIYVDGYFQSEKYFQKYRGDLLEQIQPSYEPEEEYTSVLSEVRRFNSVAVHVRHGDFGKDNNPLHHVLGDGYYRNVLKYIDGHVEKPMYFWFSDDINWVKQNFGEKDNFRFVSLKTSHADIDEMMLMKNCRNIITANSTFSWWAAWLNEQEDAIIVVPERAYGNIDMIPERRIKLKDIYAKNLTRWGATQYEVAVLLSIKNVSSLRLGNVYYATTGEVVAA